MSETNLRILGLSGEYRPSSKSGMMVNHALALAEGLGAEVFFWDCNEKPLPFVGEDGCWDNEHVKETPSTTCELCCAGFMHGLCQNNLLSAMSKKHLMSTEIWSMKPQLNGLKDLWPQSFALLPYSKPASEKHALNTPLV